MALTQDELARRLSAARERAGLTQAAVADALGLQRTAITQIESGNRAVTGLELVHLAQLFKVDVSDLVAGKDREGELVALFRMDPLLTKDDVQSEVRAALNICRIIAELETVLNEEAASEAYRESLPAPRNRTEAEQQGRDLAHRLRGKLSLGHVPIGDVNALVIRQGVGVAEHDLPEAVSGIFLSSPGQRPFILLNRVHRGPRRRFSLAHEFCHAIVDNAQRVLVSREQDDNLREKRADAFASSFLLPREAVALHLAQLNVKPTDLHFTQVADLSYRYGVSYDAATVQLRSLGLITWEKWSSLRADVTKAAAYAKKKYPERPSTMVRVTLREWAFTKMLHAFEHQLISRRKALAVARELGYEEEATQASLALLNPPDEA